MSTDPNASADVAPNVGRLYAESLRVANDETLARLAQRGLQLGRGDILHLHLSVLLDTILGDMDDERRQAYEVAVHTRLAELLAEAESQTAKMTLLQGAQGVDVAKLQRPGSHGPAPRRRR